MSTTRVGKIARLPNSIRQQLNERLADGEPGEPLLAWLNALPEVQKVLQAWFGGALINHSNLSKWRRGGFLDWQRTQQARECVRASFDEAAEIRAEWAAAEPEGRQRTLLDRAGECTGLAMLQLFREVERAAPSPERTRDMFAILRELARMSQSDSRRQRTALLQDQWKGEQARRQLFWPKKDLYPTPDTPTR